MTLTYLPTLTPSIHYHLIYEQFMIIIHVTIITMTIIMISHSLHAQDNQMLIIIFITLFMITLFMITLFMITLFMITLFIEVIIITLTLSTIASPPINPSPHILPNHYPISLIMTSSLYLIILSSSSMTNQPPSSYSPHTNTMTSLHNVSPICKYCSYHFLTMTTTSIHFVMIFIRTHCESLSSSSITYYSCPHPMHTN
jgi:hypothetical protein